MTYIVGTVSNECELPSQNTSSPVKLNGCLIRRRKDILFEALPPNTESLPTGHSLSMTTKESLNENESAYQGYSFCHICDCSCLA